MNRFVVVFFVALATSTFAEPPSPSYGLPSISTSYGLPDSHVISGGYDYKPSGGYDYKPSVAYTEYYQKHVGHIPSEGQHLDPKLLHQIKDVLIAHENSGSNKGSVISTTYGVPQSEYGPPSHWKKSSKVVDLDFGHLTQSLPVAYYVGVDRYASGHSDSGWSTGGSGWSKPAVTGWSKPVVSGWKPESSGWKSESSGWSKPAVSGWSKPAVSGWKPESTGWSSGSISPPSLSYGVPSEWSTGSKGWTKPIVIESAGWSKPAVSGWSKPVVTEWKPESSGWSSGSISPPSLSYGVPSSW